MQTALFPGDSEVQQLLHIFKLLGTPNEEVWPGVTSLRDWHEFPQWKPHPLGKVFTNLEPAGIDLMAQMFIYDPAKRISVRYAPSYAHPNVQLKWIPSTILYYSVLISRLLQAKDAMLHAYFDDLNKAEVDALESDVIRAREREAK